ncbi:uncharacterized protein LOC135197865 [Macrobrachium nipponense]|uniref:uncharacterized protein LOC135197865 n=1 Tax=Macrobrachium nipponense TaxID=159736 RepID=UPI0030C89E42
MDLISPKVHGLQRLIDTCRQYGEEFDIIYNETKTQCMSLLPRLLKHTAEPQIFLGNHRLEFVHEFPYLGHIITDDLKDTADIEQRRRKLCATGNVIAKRCNLQRWKSSLEVGNWQRRKIKEKAPHPQQLNISPATITLGR